MDRGMLAAALVAGSIGFDLLAARPESWSEAASIAAIAGVVSAAAALAARPWPWAAAAVVFALQTGVILRYGWLADQPLRSWPGVGVVVVALGGGLVIGALAREFPRGFALAAAALGGAAAIAGLASVPERPGIGVHPDIVLITLDTARRDRLSPYGGPVPMPVLEDLAARGLLFEDAVAAAPQTEPSHLAMLTGRLPARLGVVANGTKIGDHPELLARALGARGWRTGAFVSGYPVQAGFGFDQGFDRYDSDFASHRAWPSRLVDLLWTGVPRERRGDRTIARALEWAAAGSGPMFLWVHLYDPHGPYAAPAPWTDRFVESAPGPRDRDDLPTFWPERSVGDDRYWTARYDGELAFTDDLVGRLLGGLGTGPRIVAVIADHGESLGEHGVVFDHGDDLFDAAMRVPFILVGPGVPVGRYPCQATAVDLAPTLLALVGAEDGEVRDGISLVPTFSSCTDRDAWMFTVAARTERPPIAHGVRRSGEKCMAIGDRAVRFDLRADPGEERPLSGGCEDVLAFAAGAGRVLPAAGDEVTQQALERLGYVDR